MLTGQYNNRQLLEQVSDTSYYHRDGIREPKVGDVST
jgi:hypothetical protein